MNFSVYFSAAPWYFCRKDDIVSKAIIQTKEDDNYYILEYLGDKRHENVQSGIN